MGIEQEVFVNLFQQYTDHYAQWLSPSTDGYATLATSLPLAASENVSADRKADMAVLGMIVAMFLIRGISAVPLDPLLLHFFTHNCNLQIIHPTLLAEWHPKRKQIIQCWINLGPNRDPTPFQEYFASYHNIQVSHLQCQLFCSNTPYIIGCMTLGPQSENSWRGCSGHAA